MMKRMKKWIGLLLCLAIVFAMSAAAFADEEAASADDYGIIDAAELQKMFDDFVAQYNMAATGRSFSVGFCYLETGDSWYYNEGKWYYSASLYKVPVSMLFAEQVAKGETSMDTMIQTQYASGTLESLMSKAIINSNNDAGHALVEMQGGSYSGKCADQLIQYTDLDKSYFSDDFESVSYYNVKFYTQVLQTLYNNPSRFPYVIDYMKQAQPGAYLRTYLEGTYEVAQKYGAFEETKTYPPKQNNHAAGIIYTPHPIAVTVMTVNIDNYNNRIGEAAKMLADYALTLDSRLAAYNQAKELEARQEAERLAREEQERLAAEAAAAANAAAAADPSSSVASGAGTSVQPASGNGSSNGISIFTDNTPTPAPAAASSGLLGMDDDMFQKIILIAGIAIFLLGIILLIVAIVVRVRRKRDEDEDDYDDYDDGYEDDYLAPPVVKNSSRRGKKQPVYEDEEYYDEEYAQEEYADGEYEEGEYEEGEYEEEYDEYENGEYEDDPNEYSEEDYEEEEYLDEEDYLARSGDLMDEEEYGSIRSEFEEEDAGFFEEEPRSRRRR